MATDGYVDRWDDVDYNAADERRFGSVDLMPGATPFSSRSGRRPGGGGLKTTVVGSPSAARPLLRTSAGAGVVSDPIIPEAGTYRFATPSDVDLTLGDRPGTGASRIDLIVARIRDVQVGIGFESTLKVELVQGNPGSSPSAPGLPPLSMLVSTIDVPASGAITVTNSTQTVVAAGGILTVATPQERDQLKTDGLAYPGMYVDVASTKSLDRFDGTDWIVGDTGWVAPTLLNSWVNYGAAYDVAGYRKIGGRVELKGLIRNGAGNNMLVLPSGMRPAASRTWLTPSNTGIARLDVAANGTVSVISYISGGSNAFVSLDPITFTP